MAVKFGSNFTNEDLKQAKEIVELVNKTSNPGIQNQILNRNRPEVETIARGMVAGYDPDFGEEMGSLDYTPQGTLTPRAANNSSLNILNNLNKARDFRQQELNRMQGSLPVMPYTYPGGEGNQELAPQGIANVIPKVNMPSLDPGEAAAQIYRDTGPSLNPQAQAQGLGAIDPYQQFGDPLLGGDASTIFGVNAFDKKAAELLGYDMETMEGVTKYLNDTKQSMENQERDSRLDDERRERAAMLAAQQQQPVDPCPEGYRMDPVSKVCVPTDDTTEPTDPVKRTYDTMTKPEPNYTAATGFTVPSINLPDIFG